ncbi:MAG TPA: hypothetical protein VGB70_13685 [Allosphingosinicella sp.]|jgi:hypothetical protein
MAQPRAGVGGFLRATIEQLGDRRWLGIALLFLLFLGGTNIVLALYKPVHGAKPGLVFALAGLVRAVALIAISVAALRIAIGSRRSPWMPDGAFFLYFALSLLAFAAVALGAFLGRGLPDLQRILLTEVVGVLLLAPLSVWTVAAAVERPLALSPAPRLRNLGVWLPSFLLWAVILVLPLATAHAVASLHLVLWARQDGFWPLAAADAAISTLLVMITLALRVTAYRSVARP